MIFTIIAGGPSVTRDDILIAPGKIITVNTSYQACPWADYHYSNDHDWFETYIADIKVNAKGVPVCGHEDWRHPDVCSDWQIDRTLPSMSTKPSVLGWGGNSGFAAINLAYHLGARKILLLGYDMSWDGDKCHHHGRHPSHLQHKKPGFHRWFPYYDRASKDYKRLGVDVVNCSRRTELTSFRRSTIDAEL